MYPGMWQYPTNPNLCCIYRVPNCLREVNPEAYTPQLVLIGPLHHSLKSQARQSLGPYTKSMGYLNMEKHKKIYLAGFARRFEGRMTIDGFRRMIKEEEATVRASYSESTNWIQSQEFVEMVMLDSVFIMEFILRTTETREEKTGDRLMDESCLTNTVFCDLILLENQLPYFILKKLYDSITPGIHSHQTFPDLIINYFKFQGKIRGDPKILHFTDLIRCVRVETLPNHIVRKCKPIEHMYNADKLDNGGVNFKAVGDELSLYVRFENDCLEMPCLKVVDKLEMKLRNIMALEQCHYPSNTVVCDYVLFLDYLIDTEKDVDFLVEKGIIQNCIGQPASVARMVNKLGLGIIEDGSYYSDIAGEVNKYYTNPVNRSHAVLKRTYFGDLWTGTATIAAMFLLVMTFVQTVASIVQVMQNRS
ncbi:UPF0481 protein At3g47200 [Brassica rapa]|nr:UPF0481 protein At3g47200 [Brassica rapa]